MYIWLPKLGCFEPPFKFSFSVFILSLQLRYATNFFQNECQINLRFSLNERSVLRHVLCSFGSRLVLSPTIPTILTTRRSLPLSASRRTKRMLSQKERVESDSRAGRRALCCEEKRSEGMLHMNCTVHLHYKVQPTFVHWNANFFVQFFTSCKGYWLLVKKQGFVTCTS